MKRKYSYKSLSSLWENSSFTSKQNSSDLKNDIDFQKMDNLCLKAELATSSSDYAFIICSGMEQLLKTDISIDKIKSHKNLFLKVLYLGKDLMECSSFKSELFYLGTFIELKILEKWRDAKFYIFLLRALKNIRNNFSFLSKRIKEKIIDELETYNSTLHYRYFNHLQSSG